ncbi:MAG: hypothetical protein ACI4TA_08245, partial [Acetatifactor sp.]
AAVSKTACRGFKSFCPCHTKVRQSLILLGFDAFFILPNCPVYHPKVPFSLSKKQLFTLNGCSNGCSKKTMEGSMLAINS